MFFYAVIKHARSINISNQTFIQVLKSILNKESQGVKHFKYPEKRDTRQLVRTL